MLPAIPRTLILKTLAIGFGVLVSTHASAFEIGNRVHEDSASADAFANFTYSGGGAMWYGDGQTGAYEHMGGDNIQTLGNCINPGADNNSGAQCGFDVLFTDNAILNGSGNDLTIYELGGPETFYVTINGITNTASSATRIGSTSGRYQVNAYDLNLSSFGVSALDTVSSIRITLTDWGRWGSADIAVIAAINNLEVSSTVPTPSVLLLTLSGLLGLRRFRT